MTKNETLEISVTSTSLAYHVIEIDHTPNLLFLCFEWGGGGKYLKLYKLWWNIASYILKVHNEKAEILPFVKKLTYTYVIDTFKCETDVLFQVHWVNIEST